MRTMSGLTLLRRGARHCLGMILGTFVLLAPMRAFAQEIGSVAKLGDAVGASPIAIYLPALQRSGGPVDVCEPVSTIPYGTRPASYPETDRPAQVHGDKNLALRSYERTSGALGLIDYGGGSDSRAPQLRYLFADQRGAHLSAVYRVHQWDWGCNCRGPLITNPPVTLVGLVTSPGEPIYTPRSGYNIGEGYQALVLYATPERITLKYTVEDNVVHGYTIHLEGVCVDPALLALYRRCDAEGRQTLPALHGGEAIGRARTAELGVAVRDAGTFMDPRSRKDWWQNP